MNEQVEERLKYFVNGERGPSNEDVMHEVIELLQLEEGKQVKRKLKKKTDSGDEEQENLKKKKKSARDESSESEVVQKKALRKK